ncbi:hypothetical protein [Salmonirosea aquatica]|uniref:Cytochrome c oxidase polypeptide IV n=1 Tax=Salmonirosea aquatica TaxID=2654236 RepID=A0A7C9BHU8_9BACT|nr:hypothetical protein [Cytophagaceae bacterium SJW1-29]
MANQQHPWLPAEPKELPKPTYWPFFLALGVVLMLWGIPTTLYISALGGLIFVLALVRWINLLRHE